MWSIIVSFLVEVLENIIFLVFFRFVLDNNFDMVEFKILKFLKYNNDFLNFIGLDLLFENDELL